MTDREMIEALRERGYRVIREENIWTFWAEQSMDAYLVERDDAEAQEYLAQALEASLGHAIATQLRDQLQIVRIPSDKFHDAYCYHTELTVVKLEIT